MGKGLALQTAYSLAWATRHRCEARKARRIRGQLLLARLSMAWRAAADEYQILVRKAESQQASRQGSIKNPARRWMEGGQGMGTSADYCS